MQFRRMLIFSGLATSLLVASGAWAQAAPKIVNGLLTTGFPTTGALLSGSVGGDAGGICTGTLIGCGKFMTAAHCVCSGTGASCQGGNAPNPASYFVYLQHGGVLAVSDVVVHPSFNFPVADVAVLTLAAPLDGIVPTAINSTMSPLPGSAGTIAGFGNTSGSAGDYGLKHYGAVQTATCTGGISNTSSICWNFANPVGPPGADSNTCTGDSGGPLFIDFGLGTTVAGITSGGNSGNCLALDNSYDVNVYNYDAWITSQAAGDLGQTSCGSISQVGDANTSFSGFSGNLSAAVTEGRHSVSVGAGASLLRVGMNASDGADLDLYVKFGAAPTTSDYDCREFGTNSYGMCEFASPAAGTWQVLVNRHSGAATYQAITTVFGGTPPAAQCGDGLDNDGDGLIDFPNDPGCSDALDDDETDVVSPQCSDGLDNDTDGLIDFPNDPGCSDGLDDDETDPVALPACSDGIDNDGDGMIDFPADSGCLGPLDPAEAGSRCGLGPELALLIPLLPLLRRLRRRRTARPCLVDDKP